jgi:hypothetical protein
MSEILIDDAEDLRFAVLGKGQASTKFITETFERAIQLLEGSEVQEITRAHAVTESGEVEFCRTKSGTDTEIKISVHEEGEEDNPYICFYFVNEEFLEYVMNDEREAFQNAFLAEKVLQEAIDDEYAEVDEILIFQRLIDEIPQLFNDDRVGDYTFENTIGTGDDLTLTDLVQKVINDNQKSTQYVRETTFALDDQNTCVFVAECSHSFTEPVEEQVLGYLEPKIQICVEDIEQKKRWLIQLLQNNRVNSGETSLDAEEILCMGPNYEGLSDFEDGTNDNLDLLDMIGHRKLLFFIIDEALKECVDIKSD